MKTITKPVILILSFILLCAFVPKLAVNHSQKKSKARIVYNVMLNKSCSNYEIFSMNLDGSDKKNLSNWTGADWVYATHGNKIYFVSDRDSLPRQWFLYEMDGQGNNVRRISKMRLQDSYLSVDATGKKIIVCPYTKNTNWFYVLDIKTGKTLDTVIAPLAQVSDPVYLPGGRQITFRGSKEKKKAEELFVMDLDGTNLRQLTQYPEQDTSAQWYETHSGTPVWNPKSKLISYFSKQQNNHSIHTVSLDGKHRQMTDNLLNEGWHDWSSDGKFIVYDCSDLADKNFDIYLMDANGENVKRLTSDTLTEQAPLFLNY